MLIFVEDACNSPAEEGIGTGIAGDICCEEGCINLPLMHSYFLLKLFATPEESFGVGGGDEDGGFGWEVGDVLGFEVVGRVVVLHHD